MLRWAELPSATVATPSTWPILRIRHFFFFFSFCFVSQTLAPFVLFSSLSFFTAILHNEKSSELPHVNVLCKCIAAPFSLKSLKLLLWY
uniref:Uncharacterized protein n=1 Tax=Lutzomyia longipalpis TaxID=7200 RepID=A0A7G3B811_LUTLO